MATMIAALRALCDQGHFVYKMDAIVRTIRMGADESFIFN